MDRRQVVFTNLVSIAAITWCGLDQSRRYLVPGDIARLVMSASDIPPEFLPLDLAKGAEEWVLYSEARGSMRYEAETPEWLKRLDEERARAHG